MNVGGIPVMVSAQINHCNSPIDVTFRIRNVDESRYISIENQQNDFSANPQVEQFFRGLPTKQNNTDRNEHPSRESNFVPKIDWQYTFVTTNQPESREISGFYMSNSNGNIWVLSSFLRT